MDKRVLAASFRDRFRHLIESEKGNLSAFLRETGMDRSALSQFLDPKSDRLPRAETLRRIAQARGVSTDWLLCLENAPEGRQQISTLSQVESVRADDGTSPLDQWHIEAEGHKLRYVPSKLPDMISLADHSTEDYWEADARGGEVENVLTGIDLEDRDIEIAMPIQTLRDLAGGSGLWRDTEGSVRQNQLAYMAKVCADCYPAVRLHLYDGSEVFSAPFTVFGKIRAALYVGDAYLSITSPELVKVFAKRFDHLVRRAVVTPDSVHQTLAELAKSTQ